MRYCWRCWWVRSCPEGEPTPLDPDYRRHDGGKKGNQLWRIHSAFDLAERFGHFELTDQQAVETLDRKRWSRARYALPARSRRGLVDPRPLEERQLDRWQRRPMDLVTELRKAAERGLIDCPIWIRIKRGTPLALCMVAVNWRASTAALDFP